jgi:hypothetical protein
LLYLFENDKVVVFTIVFRVKKHFIYKSYDSDRAII